MHSFKITESCLYLIRMRWNVSFSYIAMDSSMTLSLRKNYEHEAGTSRYNVAHTLTASACMEIINRIAAMHNFITTAPKIPTVRCAYAVCTQIRGMFKSLLLTAIEIQRYYWYGVVDNYCTLTALVDTKTLSTRQIWSHTVGRVPYAIRGPRSLIRQLWRGDCCLILEFDWRGFRR